MKWGGEIMCCVELSWGAQYLIRDSFKLVSEYKLRTSSKEYFISFVHVFALNKGVMVGRQHKGDADANAHVVLISS